MIDPYLQALLMVLGGLAIIGVFGLYWARQEREAYRARRGGKHSG